MELKKAYGRMDRRVRFWRDNLASVLRGSRDRSSRCSAAIKASTTGIPFLEVDAPGEAEVEEEVEEEDEEKGRGILGMEEGRPGGANRRKRRMNGDIIIRGSETGGWEEDEARGWSGGRDIVACVQADTV